MVKTQAYTQTWQNVRFMALCRPRWGRAFTTSDAHGLGIDLVRILEDVP